MGLGMFIGSMLPPILWGVAIANFMVGVPIDESKNMVGGFCNYFIHLRYLEE